ELVLAIRCETLRVGDERGQPLQPLARAGGVPRQLVLCAPGSLQLAPGAARLRDALAHARESVERRELVARPGEAALLELPAHRDQCLGGGCDVLARSAPPPGVGARPAVGEDSPGEHERVLALRAERGELAEDVVVRQVEL